MKQIAAIILIIILFIVAFFGTGIYLPVEKNSTKNVEFLVEKGEGAKEISIKLKEEGLIRWSSLFRFYVLIKEVSNKLKAGKYLLSKTMNIPDMVGKFVSGDVVKEEITIIEGWNLKDIGKYFEEKGIATSEELSKVSQSEIWKSEKFDFLKDKSDKVGLEGYLFPDTYEIHQKVSLEEIVGKMLSNFDKKLSSDLREEIKKQGKSIFEIITMASLLEKEVQTLEDKKIVSGILWKRLENKIPLQVDATIIYLTGKKSSKISRKETQIDSPFNTYKYKGLPLGPISNPGLESIIAAIYPQDSEYWYYLSTPEGETIFSKTLEEHNVAKQEYLK